jgi:hypothetical protein
MKDRVIDRRVVEWLNPDLRWQPDRNKEIDARSTKARP